ncbi:hypothetical protein L484_027965 [Morus notabilis]|uniref:Uncharacterized protein n=1 Tax=Morus notabilis TaxID=981085 RepID=W9SFS7_9ROSA|nr:hypothetical protein L484_027965 [Morus notabilis]
MALATTPVRFGFKNLMETSMVNIQRAESRALNVSLIAPFTIVTSRLEKVENVAVRIELSSGSVGMAVVTFTSSITENGTSLGSILEMECLVKVDYDNDVFFYLQLKKKDVHVLSKFPLCIDSPVPVMLFLETHFDIGVEDGHDDDEFNDHVVIDMDDDQFIGKKPHPHFVNDMLSGNNPGSVKESDPLSIEARITCTCG